MQELELFLIVPLSFFAFLLKSVAAFGPGVVLVPLGALVFGAKEVVVVIGFLDLISNTALFKLDHAWVHKGFWLPMALAAVIGSAIGAAFLAWAPANYFNIVFGLALLPLGLWFMLGGRARKAAALADDLSAHPGRVDLAVAATAGCLGGLIGITGPALAWHLGRRYTKALFRKVMIPILFASALARVTTYIGAGVVSGEALTLVALALPGLFLGILVGNRIFARISEIWFSRIVGGLITLSGARLLS
ncbi:MAG: sulfite exporter TauE/SafE family protein [Acidiferrobacterales bacterium]